MIRDLLAVAVIVLAIAAMLIVLNGCDGASSTQRPTLTTTPTGAAPVTAGDGSKILQDIRQQLHQVQTTISEVANNTLQVRKAQADTMNITHGGIGKRETQGLAVSGLFALSLLIACLAAPSPGPQSSRFVLALYLAAGVTFCVALALTYRFFL